MAARGPGEHSPGVGHGGQSKEKVWERILAGLGAAAPAPCWDGALPWDLSVPCYPFPAAGLDQLGLILIRYDLLAELKLLLPISPLVFSSLPSAGFGIWWEPMSLECPGAGGW